MACVPYEPLEGTAPKEPVGSAKVQPVLLVVDQLRVDIAPLAIIDGDAERVTVVDCVGVADPPPPPHEARPEAANNTAKRALNRTLEPTALLFDMIVSLQ